MQEVIKIVPQPASVPTDFLSALDKWGPWVVGTGFMGWFFITKGWPWMTTYIESRDKWAVTQVEIAQQKLSESQDRLHEVIGNSLSQLAEHNKVLMQLKDGLAAILVQGTDNAKKLDLLINRERIQ